ncbi:hypothetical protein Pint_18105 [Pistacia integerrima]|uniref:Uncharacterized protein n=1 Tax=Pistacia integerrima TaxID=434235 RepID=A0ACC0YXS4_9ROSI|nr:hypothetical protein Pint_18105 [Pistacia integerrima]
MTLSSLISQRI